MKIFTVGILTLILGMFLQFNLESTLEKILTESQDVISQTEGKEYQVNITEEHSALVEFNVEGITLKIPYSTYKYARKHKIKTSRVARKAIKTFKAQLNEGK